MFFFTQRRHAKRPGDAGSISEITTVYIKFCFGISLSLLYRQVYLLISPPFIFTWLHLRYKWQDKMIYLSRRTSQVNICSCRFHREIWIRMRCCEDQLFWLSPVFLEVIEPCIRHFHWKLSKYSVLKWGLGHYVNIKIKW